jgi:hypothetical protein
MSDENGDPQHRRTAIVEAIGALRRGEDDDAVELCALLAGSSGRALRDSVLDLAEADTEMLRGMIDPGPGEDLLDVLVGSEGPAGPSVDELEPERRTSLRVLLACVAGHREDAEAQLSVAADGDPAATGPLLVHALGRTMKLLSACVRAGRPVPDWLRPVLAW